MSLKTIHHSSPYLVEYSSLFGSRFLRSSSVMPLLASPFQCAPTLYAKAVSAEYVNYASPLVSQLIPFTSCRETDDDQQHEVVICLQTLKANSDDSRIGPQEDDGDGHAKKRESFCREFGHVVGIMSTGYPAWCRKTTSLMTWSKEEGETSSSRVMPGGVLRRVGKV